MALGTCKFVEERNEAVDVERGELCILCAFPKADVREGLWVRIVIADSDRAL